jgi:Fe-S cluster biosynthesis and repair protein YggX
VKYGVNEVFDIRILDSKGEVLFDIQSVGEIEMEVNATYAYLKIEDVLLNKDLLDKVLDEDIYNEQLSIEGWSIWRDANTMIDEEVKLYISEAYIKKYNPIFGFRRSAFTLTLKCPIVTSKEKNQNIRFEV